MKIRNALALSVAGGAVGVSLAWRFASRRYTLPCPHWLTVLLENPFMNTAAGSAAILDRLAIQPGMKLLDVGTGRGESPCLPHSGLGQQARWSPWIFSRRCCNESRKRRRQPM